MEQRADAHHSHLVLEIDKKLDKLSPIPSERCIFKVHELLRNSNVKAYEPEVVAIGPYHHAKYDKNAHLRPMEEHKLRYLKQLLERRKETSLESYVVAMRQLEGKARDFYAEPSSLSTNEFVEMMLLDGCFIIELLRKNMKREWRLPDDPVFQLIHIWEGVSRDLLLFENQLPLFILGALFSLSKKNPCSSPDRPIIPRMVPRMVHTFFKGTVSLYVERFDEGVYQMEGHTHLLSLVHCYTCQQFKSLKPGPPRDENEGNNQLRIKISNIKPATELQEAGVKFKKVERSSFFDITFQNGSGIMEIPTLFVHDGTESLLRNFIAYEQYLPKEEIKYFTNYTHFIDCLVNSSKDVELFRDLGIFDSLLGDDGAVSSMLNKLGHGAVVFNDSNYCYGEVMNEVNKHCRQRRYKWLAKLRRDYFNSPWALISFAAAFALLLFTATQTVFSILPVV